MRVIYNPAFLSHEQQIEQFVVREAELQLVLSALSRSTGPAHQHLIVIGGRGFGKSTLVRRVAAEIARDESLSGRFFPLLFPEEPYEVSDIGEFWLFALAQLAEQTRDPRWERLHTDLRRERDKRRLEIAARGALKSHAEEKGRVVILVVENIDMMFDQMGDDDASALRRVLQTDPDFLLLATALRPFDAITDHSKPFYEGLRRIELPPLTPEEIDRLWASVSGAAPGIDRASAIRVLTGGNPRLVVLLAKLARGQSLRSILEDLTRLIDAHTDYFKSNIEALEGQQRKVFLALATLWRPATAGEIAEEARLDSNTVSSVLSRLERQGRVEVAGKRGKNRKYQVAERLYNIYYLVRRGRSDARLQALVDFMLLFYAPEELSPLTSRLAREFDPGAGALDPCARVVNALLESYRSEPERRASVLQQIPEALRAHVNDEELQIAKQRPEEVLALLKADGGERFLFDAGELLTRNLASDDERYIALAEHLLSRPESDDRAHELAVQHLASREHHAPLLSAFDEERYERRGIVLAIFSITVALWSSDRAVLGEWSERLAQRPLPGAAFSLLLALFLQPSDPAPAAALAEALRAPSPLDPLLGPLIERLIAENAREALAQITSALSSRETEGGWVLAARARIASALGDHAAAATLSEALIAQGSAGAHLVAAAAAVARGDRSIARAHLERSSEVDTTPELQCLQAELYEHLGESARAITLATALVRGLPARSALWEILARGAPERALALWSERSEPGQEVARAFARGALHASDRRLWEAALGALTEERSFEQNVLRAHLHGLLGRPDLALDRFSALVRAEPLRESERLYLHELSLVLAASGQGEGVAKALYRSPHAATFRPLLLALDPALQSDASAEERAVAADVSARIEGLRAQTDLWRPEVEPNPSFFPSLALL